MPVSRSWVRGQIDPARPLSDPPHRTPQKLAPVVLPVHSRCRTVVAYKPPTRVSGGHFADWARRAPAPGRPVPAAWGAPFPSPLTFGARFAPATRAPSRSNRSVDRAPICAGAQASLASGRGDFMGSSGGRHSRPRSASPRDLAGARCGQGWGAPARRARGPDPSVPNARRARAAHVPEPVPEPVPDSGSVSLSDSSGLRWELDCGIGTARAREEGPLRPTQSWNNGGPI